MKEPGQESADDVVVSDLEPPAGTDPAGSVPGDAVPDGAGSVPTGAAPVRARRRISPLRVFIVVLAIVVLVPVVVVLGSGAATLLDRDIPSTHLPPGYDVHAVLPSVSGFVRAALAQPALDAMLSGPALSPYRGIARSMRSDTFLASDLFMRLADVPADLTLYPDGSFMAAADIGLRAAVLRFAPALARLFPGLLGLAPGLSYRADAAPPHFEYVIGALSLHVLLRGKVLVVASSEGLLVRAERSSYPVSGLRAAPAIAEGVNLRLELNLERFAGLAAGADDPLGRLLAGLRFGELPTAELSLRDDRVELSVDVPLHSGDESVQALLDRRSVVPAILTRLPASAEYCSILSAGTPDQLWAAAGPALGPGAQEAYRSADEAARLALRMDLVTLFYSWMGGELGVLGSSAGPAPVFFVEVADERARAAVFDRAFGTLLVGRDLSAVVDGVRVPRIVFPKFIRAFLEAVGVKLAEPFYLVHDGFLYCSASAETLAACVAELRNGSTLAGGEAWRDAVGGLSPESAAMVWYTLDRSAPFFLRGSSGVAAALSLYRRGLASVRFEDGSVRLSLSAVAAPGDPSVESPGYPLKPGGRIDSDPVAARSDSGAPLAYWMGGRVVRGLDLGSGRGFELELDDTGWVLLNAPDGVIRSVSAVSARGTVYRADASLAPLAGYPLVTGRPVSGPPAAVGDRLAIPVSEGPSLMLVDAAGSVSFSAAMHARVRSAPVETPWGLAALPRSFDPLLYLFDAAGVLVPGWPVRLPGLASAPPVVGQSDSGPLAAVTEAGALCAFRPDGTAADGFPVSLGATFDAAPAWSAAWNSYYLVSVEGGLWRVSGDGTLMGSTTVARGGRGSMLTAVDLDGDGRDELLLSGGGDALYAYGGDLAPVPGYPVPGAGPPAMVDIDGDGVDELVVRGTDDSLHAYLRRPAGGRE